MKVRSIVLTLTLCFVAAAVCVAADVQMGTWKLNESKSKLNPNMGKNHTVIYIAEPQACQPKITKCARN